MVGPFPGGQSDDNFSLAVDPTDPHVIYVGGDRQPRAVIETASGTLDYSGRLFISDLEYPVNKRFLPIVGDYANNTSPHADSRVIAFDANGNLLEGDDGGIYRLLWPTQQDARVWQSVNGDLRPTELYSVAYDSRNDDIIAGTQDVGSIEQIVGPTNGEAGQWRDARLLSLLGFWSLLTAEGDGGHVAVDNVSNSGAAIRYTMGNHLGMFYRRDYVTSSPGVIPVLLQFHQENLVNAPPWSGLDPSDSILRSGFVRVPFELNRREPKRMVIGGNALYESSDMGATVRRADLPRQGRPVDALAYGGADSANTARPGVLYAARGNELSVRDDFGTIWTRRFISGAAFSTAGAVTMRSIVVDPENWRTAYVLTRDSVFRIDAINDSSETITNITGALTVVKAFYDSVTNSNASANLQTLEIVRVPGRRAVLLAAAQGGVYRLLDPERRDPADGLIPWEPFGLGLPRVLVTGLVHDATDDVLVAGTWGRGAWSIGGATEALFAPRWRWIWQ
jgi:hypothetical protein